MDLRTLRSFVAVAEERHVTRAARRLHIAQPAVSQQIRQLEREVGVELLVRSRRGVQLTAAGEALHIEARKVLEAASAARDAATRAARGEVGRLIVGFAPAARSILPAAVRSFRAGSPNIDVVLCEVDPRAQVDALLAGRLDIGLMHDVIETSRVDAEVLWREPFVLALPADHALVHRRSIRLAELRSEAFVVPGAAPGDPSAHSTAFNSAVLVACAAAGFAPRVAQRAPDLETRLLLVAAGMGISLVLDRARPPRAQGVVFRPLAGPALTLDLLALWRGRTEAPVVTAFRAALRAAAGPNDRAT